MLAIIPNPNQLTELVKIQKDFIHSNTREDGRIFYQNTPLWIFISDNENSFLRDFSKEELKGFSAELIKVELEKPDLYFSKNLQQLVLGCHSRVSTASGILQGELVLCKTAKAVTGRPTSQCPQPSLNLCDAKVPERTELSFPIQLKVFRIGNAVRPDKNSFSLTDFVWKKIKE